MCRATCLCPRFPSALQKPFVIRPKMTTLTPDLRKQAVSIFPIGRETQFHHSEPLIPPDPASDTQPNPRVLRERKVVDYQLTRLDKHPHHQSQPCHASRSSSTQKSTLFSSAARSARTCKARLAISSPCSDIPRSNAAPTVVCRPHHGVSAHGFRSAGGLVAE
jgi:hypothetical protein